MNKYEEVITSCNGLIYTIINKYFKGYNKEDLYQVGVLGVIKAYDNYKKNNTTKFSTYAYKYIFGEMYAYINNTKLLKVSKEYYSLNKKINEARNILSQRLMKEPTLNELSSFLEIDPNIIENINIMFSPLDSLDKTIYNEGKDITLFDTISDNKDYYNIDYLMLYDILDNLPSPEKEIIYMHYFEDKTQTEIADHLGLNQVDVSRKESKTLKKIRQNYQNVA